MKRHVDTSHSPQKYHLKIQLGEVQYWNNYITLCCPLTNKFAEKRHLEIVIGKYVWEEALSWQKKLYIFRTFANVMNPQVNWEFTIVELWLYKNIIYEGTKQVFKKIRDATTNIQGLKKEVHYYSSKFFLFLWSIRVASSQQSVWKPPKIVSCLVHRLGWQVNLIRKFSFLNLNLSLFRLF